MPVYEYSCSNGCENYEVWRRIDERQVDIHCPACSAEGQRVYTPILSLNGPLRLKQESSEPRLVRKEVPGSNGPAKPRLKQSGTRPWMLNRGC